MAETQNIAVNALPVEAPQKTDYLLGIGASEEFRATVEDFVEATDVVSDLANSNVQITDELTANQNSGFLRKNLLKNTTGSATQNGITFTVNADDTVLANGTNSGGAFVRYIDTNATDWSGQSLILNGCPSGGSTSTYALRVYEAGNGKGHDTGSGLAFTGASNNRIGIFVAAGATLNNVTFKPMVRPATIEDGTYVPYVPSNSALNADLTNTLSFDFSPFNVDFPSGSVSVASFLTWLNANAKEATHGMRKIIASNGVIIGIALISAVSGSYGAMTVISYYAIHGQYHLASGTWSVRLENTSSAEIKTGATVRKNNKTVWLSLVNLAVTASTILNVPAGYRPIDRVSFIGNWKNTSNQYESVLITVWSSGDVVAFSPTLNANISNGTLTASGVWLAS